MFNVFTIKSIYNLQDFLYNHIKPKLNSDTNIQFTVYNYLL